MIESVPLPLLYVVVGAAAYLLGSLPSACC
jgi:hypothetical protein